jgi:SWI/SNF-related matrix-associated actin-dependent regulator 1 of chromatin subfamily A
MHLTIELDARGWFNIKTGGVVVPQISEWLGWRRTPKGLYIAPPWPTSVLGIAPSPSATLLWSKEAQELRDRLLADLNGARTMLKLGHSPIETPTERKPRQHQLQAVHAMRHMGWRVLLADDMGLGKTSSALWAAHDAKVKTLLVVCPVSVKFNWQNEIRETLGEGWLTIVVNGNSKKRADQIAEAAAHAQGSTASGVAVVINYDLLLHLTDEQSAWLHTFASRGMVLFDESHYLKSAKAKRTQECQGIAEHSRYVSCLTGTPIRNLADDLFTQVELVRPGTWTSYRDFAKRYLVIQSVKFGKRDVQKVVGTRNLDELNAVMNTVQISRKKHDAIDLPPKIRTYPELELEGDLKKLYLAMRDFARMELSKLGDVKLSVFDPRAKSAVEQAMRCEQIAQGFVGGIPDPVMAQLGADVLKHAEKIPGRPNELIFPNAPKIIWLLEAIESVIAQGGAPLVFTRFNGPMGWVHNTLLGRGFMSATLSGELAAEQKDGVVKRFQDGTHQVLIAQIKMAEGWNAYRSQDVLFLGRDWSPFINYQAEDRAHRMGQKGTVNVQIPIVRKTVEVMIDRRLRAKDADANQALRTVTIAELMDAL